jgi:uncharacterized protein (UPF0332 family)
VSPRSAEFLASAHERVASARSQLESGHPETAASTAYYAMLYAARAALSERDRYARTHRGTWMLFRELFVVSGDVEAALYDRAQEARRLREGGDYEAHGATAAEAQAATAAAAQLVEAVEQALARD